MKNINKFKNYVSQNVAFVLLIATSVTVVSCDPTIDSLSFDVAEANSIADQTPPAASFVASQSAGSDEAWKEFTFANGSVSATTYVWDFGDGNTSTDVDGINTYSGEGTFTVTLTAQDNLGATSTYSETIEVVEPEVPLSIQPEILNGDFNDGQDNWKFSSFSGGTTSPYNSSSDGSWLNYDGTDNGSKTPGAKWTSSTSSGAYLSSSTRYAYQEILVSPNTAYILEYEYAIKNDGTQAPGDNRIIGGIIDGYFADGANAIASFDANPLLMYVGSEDLGKTVFTTVTAPFTSNATGEIAILIQGVTDVDAYVDNVKVYPAE